ncbi:hypothetical protein F7725_008978, partial [Dissostichus mawsoni]
AEDTEHVATQAEDTEHVGTQAEDTEHVGTQAEDTEHAGDQAQNPENAVTEKHRETNEEYVILILEPVSVDERRDEIQQRGRKRKRDPDNWKKNARKRLRNSGQSYHVVLYSDTCGGQNRNAGFSAMCLHAVKTLPISIIDHKFMESGHSQMECDSVHAAIETARKKKIKWLRYTKEDPKGIQFKYSLSDQPFQMLQVGKQETRGAHAIGPKKMHTGPPGITAVKKKDLLTLCTNGSIPQSYVDFYQSLQVIQAE